MSLMVVQKYYMYKIDQLEKVVQKKTCITLFLRFDFYKVVRNQIGERSSGKKKLGKNQAFSKNYVSRITGCVAPQYVYRVVGGSSVALLETAYR